MHELVAPRPLRLTATPSFALRSPTSSPLIRRKPSVRLVAPTDSHTRIPFSEGNDETPAVELERSQSTIEDLEVRRETTSPRLSPDPLEEFLSILQPVMFTTPSSPIMRSRYDRPLPYRPWSHMRSRSSASVSNEDGSRPSDRAISQSGSVTGEECDELGEGLTFEHRPWPYSSFLSSPVSRMHTQNPLARYVSHEFDVTSYIIRTSSPISSPALLSLAQSIPIPPSPPAHVSLRVASPQLMEV